MLRFVRFWLCNVVVLRVGGGVLGVGVMGWVVIFCFVGLFGWGWFFVMI